MPLLKDGRVVDDAWRHSADDEPLLEGEPATVSLKRWSGERDALYRRNGRLGLRLPNDAVPASLAGDVARFDLIILSFPRFTDGRAYSQARVLRSRLGFRGELRATGNVLRDQLLFMRRCGIDAFEVSERAVAENWLAALGDLDVFYQPAEDGRPWIARQRAGQPGRSAMRGR
jgi:uncharacterized protein (DUF934 family)